MKKTCFCGISEHCGYQIETDMEQHDKVIYEQGYNKAIDDFEKKIQSRKGYFEEYYPNDNIAISEANVYLEIAKELKRKTKL